MKHVALFHLPVREVPGTSLYISMLDRQATSPSKATSILSQSSINRAVVSRTQPSNLETFTFMDTMHFPFCPFYLLLGLLFFLHYQALAEDEFIIPPDFEKYDDSSSTWTYIADTQAYLQWTTDEREVDLYLLMRSSNSFELLKGIQLSKHCPIPFLRSACQVRTHNR